MNLTTIEMDRTEARKAFLEYRRAVRDRHDEEDQQIMRGYRALASGNQLINLPQTMRAGGSEVKSFKRNGYQVTFHVPRLAVIRANAKVCYTTGVRNDGSIVLAADKVEQDLHISNRKDIVRFGAGTFEPGTAHWRLGPYIKAIVPNVPPPLRPTFSLSGYVILWEAEWSLHPAPPKDPALLKHIGGDLYAVLAIWDLTELERTVLAARVHG